MKKSLKGVKTKKRIIKAQHVTVSIRNSEKQKNKMKKLLDAMFDEWKNSKP
jgi:hypothetical protein